MGTPILNPGDAWDDPAEGYYRGSKYHCNAKREVWWSLPHGLGVIKASSGHEAIADLLLAIRPEGGSFRITEDGSVITKDPATYKPIYVCEYDLPLEFEHVDVLGTGVEPLDLWPSFYDGSRYSFKKKQTWWRDPDSLSWRRTRQALPQQLRDQFFKVKTDGGSIRITENGKVLVLITPQPLPRHIERQYKALNNVQKQLIAVKTKSTELLPIYLGEFHGSLTLEPPFDLNDPIPPAEEAELLSFLSRYATSETSEEPGDLDPLTDIEDRIDEGGES